MAWLEKFLFFVYKKVAILGGGGVSIWRFLRLISLMLGYLWVFWFWVVKLFATSVSAVFRLC